MGQAETDQTEQLHELTVEDMRLLADAVLLHFPALRMYGHQRILEAWRDLAKEHRLRTLGPVRAKRLRD